MFQPHLIDVEQPGVAGNSLYHLHHSFVNTLDVEMLFQTIQAAAVDGPLRALQARRSLWRIEHVPRTSQQARERDEAALSCRGAQG